VDRDNALSAVVANLGRHPQLWNDDPKGKPDYQFVFGPAGAGLQPIAGDWDGDGKGYDSVGVYEPATSVFYLKDTNKSGGPDHAVKVNPKGPGALPLAGDWDDTGFSKVGLYDFASGEVRLRTSLTSGAAQYTRTFVPGLEQVFTGRWNATKHAPGGKQKIKRGSKPAVGIDFEDGEDSSQVRLNLTPVLGTPAPQTASAASHTRPLATQVATATWNYTIRDENNRPSIEYHLGPLNGFIVDRLYAYLGARLIATYEFQPLNGSPGWVYHTTDHLGSTRLEGTTAGNKVHDYWPFGEEAPQTPLTHNSEPMRFAGMERDPASGNDYDHARYCSSTQGRFLSPDKLGGDPEDPQSWNRYVYARNNPVALADPDGQAWVPSQELQARFQKNAAIRADVANYLERTGNGLFRSGVDTVLSVFLPTGPEFAASAMAIAGDVIIPEAGAATAVPKVIQNAQQGKAAEAAVGSELQAEGKTILGSQVSVRTSEGRRVVDHLESTRLVA
jgi:RHS repeat-associated protein